MSARDTTPRFKTYTELKQKTWMKKERTDTTGKLLRTLDLVFAKYIRSKSKNCYTCESEKATECGHFMKRGNHSTRWLETNARPQGFYCNRVLDGNREEFRKRLIAEIGEEKVLEIETLSRLDIKFSPSDLEEMIFMYKEKLKK